MILIPEEEIFKKETLFSNPEPFSFPEPNPEDIKIEFPETSQPNLNLPDVKLTSQAEPLLTEPEDIAQDFIQDRPETQILNQPEKAEPDFDKLGQGNEQVIPQVRTPKIDQSRNRERNIQRFQMEMLERSGIQKAIFPGVIVGLGGSLPIFNIRYDEPIATVVQRNRDRQDIRVARSDRNLGTNKAPEIATLGDTKTDNIVAPTNINLNPPDIEAVNLRIDTPPTTPGALPNFQPPELQQVQGPSIETNQIESQTTTLPQANLELKQNRIPAISRTEIPSMTSPKGPDFDIATEIQAPRSVNMPAVEQTDRAQVFRNPDEQKGPIIHTQTNDVTIPISQLPIEQRESTVNVPINVTYQEPITATEVPEITQPAYDKGVNAADQPLRVEYQEPITATEGPEITHPAYDKGANTADQPLRVTYQEPISAARSPEITRPATRADVMHDVGAPEVKFQKQEPIRQTVRTTSVETRRQQREEQARMEREDKAYGQATASGGAGAGGGAIGQATFEVRKVSDDYYVGTIKGL